MKIAYVSSWKEHMNAYNQVKSLILLCFFRLEKNGELSTRRRYVRLSVTNSSNKTFFSAIVYITYICIHNIWYPDGMFNFFVKMEVEVSIWFSWFKFGMKIESTHAVIIKMPTHMWIWEEKEKIDLWI